MGVRRDSLRSNKISMTKNCLFRSFVVKLSRGQNLVVATNRELFGCVGITSAGFWSESCDKILCTDNSNLHLLGIHCEEDTLKGIGCRNPAWNTTTLTIASLSFPERKFRRDLLPATMSKHHSHGLIETYCPYS
jgi:hypothetical protein